jgi:hypothetical protein
VSQPRSGGWMLGVAATSIRTVSTVVALNARQFPPEYVKILAGVEYDAEPRCGRPGMPGLDS